MFDKFALTLGLTVTAAAVFGGWFGSGASAAPAPHVAHPAVFDRTSASEAPQLGAAVNDVMLAEAGPRYVQTLLARYRSITPEWEMEMSQLEPDGRSGHALLEVGVREPVAVVEELDHIVVPGHVLELGMLCGRLGVPHMRTW